MWYVVLTFKDDIFRSDFCDHFKQFQHHNITSNKRSDQNNERFYQVKQTVENRRPSKMGDVAILLFVHYNFIIQLWNIFFFLLKSIPHCILSQLHALFIEFYSFCVCFSKICIRIQWYVVSSVFWKKLTFVAFLDLTLLVRCEEIYAHIN